MSLLTNLVFVSLVLSEWKHFSVEHFLVEFCDLDNHIFPRTETKLRCYNVRFTINQRYDIQSKHFTISNSSEIVFNDSEVDPLNDMFFRKFPKAWSMEFINSTVTFSSNHTNGGVVPLETLILKESYIIKPENSSPFTSLMNLKRLLIVSSNFSDSTLDKNLLKFTSNLTSIYIISTNLRSIENGAFENLPNLKELSIIRSTLCELPGDIFLNNKALLRLDLSNDLFDEIPDVEFPQSLEELKMSFNYLQGIQRKDFDHLMNLRGLHLHGNYIQDFPIDTFWDMDFLEDLVLTKNNIETISWKHFMFCTKLEWLDIEDNFLKEDSVMGSRIPYVQIKSQRQKVIKGGSRSFYDDFWLLFV